MQFDEFKPRRRMLACFALALGSLVAGCAGFYLSPAADAQSSDPSEHAAAPKPSDAARIHASYLEARLAIEGQYYDEAMKLLEECHQANGCPPEVYVAMAQVYGLQNKADKAISILDEGQKTYPDSVPLLAARSTALRQSGKTDEAIATLEAALKVEPNRQVLLEELKDDYLSKLRASKNNDDLDKSIHQLASVYERMLPGRRGSQRLPPLLVLTSLFTKMGDNEKAVAYAREAVEIRPREIRAQLSLGDALSAAGKTDEALETYGNAHLIDPDNSEVQGKLEENLRAKGPAARRDFYRKLAEAHPENHDLQNEYAQMLIDERRWADAEPLLKAMHERWPDDPRPMLGLVAIWLSQNRYDDAVKAARELAAQPMESAGPHLAMAVATTLMMRGGEQGAKAAESVLGSLPAKFVSDNESEIDLLRVEIMSRQGQNQQAYDLMKTVVEHNPTSATLMMQAGTLAQNLGKNSEAEDYFRKAIATDPNDSETYNCLGYFYAETNQKLDEAQKLVNKALEIKPNEGNIVDSLGWVLYHKGDYPGAVTQLRRAIELTSQDPDATIYAHLGDALEKNGNKDEARQTWQRALVLGPNRKMEKELRAKLGSDADATPNPAGSAAGKTIGAGR